MAKIEYWFRNRILLTLAWWIKEYYGDKICWAQLVMWALYNTDRHYFESALSGAAECKAEIVESKLVGCYCGHFNRNWSVLPYISLEFMLFGRR